MVQPSIQYLELFAQVAGVLAWGYHFANHKVVIHCDNNSVVAMINNTSSSCKNCMILLRILTHHCLVINLKIFAKHIETQKNGISDSLSRFQANRFERLTKGLNLDHHSTPIPTEIWPAMDIWFD